MIDWCERAPAMKYMLEGTGCMMENIKYIERWSEGRI